MATKQSKSKPFLDPVVASIVAARREQRITQAVLAQWAGVSRRTVVMIESGGDCTLSTLRYLTNALELDITAQPRRRPTLEDVTRENEALFAATHGASRFGFDK